MAVTTRGKQFEQKFYEDFRRTFPNGTLERIYDTVGYYKGVTNISDYIGYNYPYMFFIECKAHKGASMPIANITQYEKLKTKIGIKGVRAGVVLWLYDKDKVFYIPVRTLSQMLADNEKSVGIRSINQGYNIIDIPSKKKRFFMDSDYSLLMRLDDLDNLEDIDG